MNKIIKGTLWIIIVIVAIILIPNNLIVKLCEWIRNAIKWVVFIDNAETGLPIVAEIIIKAICEIAVGYIAVSIGVSKNGVFATVISIVIGFVACVLFYTVCTYIVWVLVFLVVFCVAITIMNLITRKKTKGKYLER